MDSATGLATLSCSTVGSDSGSVRINLINGQLSVLKPKPARCGATESLCPSPDGDYKLQYTEKPTAKIEVKDRRGKKLGEIEASDSRGFADSGWSPRADACYVVCYSTGDSISPDFRGGDDSGESGLFVFGIKNRVFRQAVRGSIGEVQWSSDGRYIACIMSGGKRPDNLPLTVRGVGSLEVCESSSLRRVPPLAGLVFEYKFSPNGKAIAFTQMVKDEYGDPANYALRVADISSGRILSVVTNRRQPKYQWAGNDRLGVVTYDKYSVPSVSLVDLSTCKWTRLATMPEFAALEPLAYVSSASVVACRAATSVSGTKPEELWAARPGGAPLRLFPKVGGARDAKH